MFEPLRVTASLMCGVVCDRWLPLDGILLAQAAREQYGALPMTTPGGNDLPGEIVMPLAIVHAGAPHWYYACSWAQPQPWWVAEGQDHWNKRLDSDLAACYSTAQKIVIEKGAYKAYHMPVFYYIAHRVTWYAVGDAAEIRALLSTCTHIGKKRDQGWGRVIEWRVEPWPEDWSRYGPDGLPTRGVPVAEGERINIGCELINYAVRPPGYIPENHMVLAVAYAH